MTQVAKISMQKRQTDLHHSRFLGLGTTQPDTGYIGFFTITNALA